MDTKCEETYLMEGWEKVNFYTWMLAVIHSNDDQDVYKQLELICRYGYFFLAPFEHMRKFKERNNNQDFEFIPDGIGKTDNKINMQILSKQYRIKWAPSGSVERSRISARTQAKRTCSFGIFAPETSLSASFKKFIPNMHPHFHRG
jgi:hypothetical protein